MSRCSLCCTKIEGLGVNRGNFEILKDINLHIHCGELTAVIGPNGAGKSTLLKAILGETPHSGTLTFLDAGNGQARQPLVGYVPQKLDFDYSSPVSVYDLFAAAHTIRPVWLSHTAKMREHVRKSLARVQVEHLGNRRLGALSGGELQRVMLALALDPIPNLLLLDEPLSGIDRKGLEMFYQTVSELRESYDLSIILVSHDLDLVARHADRVVFLHNKTVACQGTAKEVFDNPQVIEVFGLGFFKQSPAKEGERG